MTEPLPVSPPRRRIAIRTLALALALAMGIVTALLGAVTYRLVHEELEQQIDDRVEAESRSLLEHNRKYGFDALLYAVRQREADHHDYIAGAEGGPGSGTGYIVVDRDGVRRAGSLRAEMPASRYSEFVRFVRSDGSHGIAQGLNSPLPGGGHLLVAVDRAAIGEMDETLFRLFAAAFGILILLGMGATIILGRVVRQRLDAFEKLASAVADGDIHRRMPLGPSSVEFDPLAQTLNRMLDRISSLVANLREVSTGLAHDLRTPLARIRTRIEQAEAAAQSPAERRSLDQALTEMDALLELFSGLLAISEVDAQGIRGRFVMLDFATAVTDIAEAHRPAIEDGGRFLTLDVGGPASVRGDRALLQRLVGHLLDNAQTHTPEGTRINVSLKRDAGRVELLVSDDGPGVPAIDRARIFDRLVRLDPARARPGHGLGLSMVSAIAAAHGGSVRVLPTELGLSVVLELPAEDDEA